jgi:hypothetical protein
MMKKPCSRPLHSGVLCPEMSKLSNFAGFRTAWAYDGGDVLENDTTTTIEVTVGRK